MRYKCITNDQFITSETYSKLSFIGKLFYKKVKTETTLYQPFKDLDDIQIYYRNPVEEIAHVKYSNENTIIEDVIGGIIVGDVISDIFDNSSSSSDYYDSSEDTTDFGGFDGGDFGGGGAGDDY